MTSVMTVAVYGLLIELEVYSRGVRVTPFLPSRARHQKLSHRLEPRRRAARAPQTTLHAMIALAAFCAAAAQLANKHTECDGWARAGECNGNPQFMNKDCARSCAEVVVEPGAEMEQCPGWASQGECTRNPKFMMTTCPRNCAEQRAKVVDGLLDTSPSCIDSANAAVSTCVDMHAVPQPCCSRAAAGPQPGRLYGLRLAAVPDAPEAQGHSPSRATRRLGLSYRAA